MASFVRAYRSVGLAMAAESGKADNALVDSTSKSSFSGFDDRHGPVGDLKLAEDIGHIVGDGLWTERKPVGDLRIVHACTNQFQYLAFAFGEIRIQDSARTWRG